MKLVALAMIARRSFPTDTAAASQATGLTFATTGCWRVTGRFRHAELTFTVLVTKSRLGP